MQCLKASPQGLTRIRQVRAQITQETGWAIDNPQWLWCASAFLPQVKDDKGIMPRVVSIGTWKRFLTGKPIKPNNFKAFCQVLRLNWEEVIICDLVTSPQGENEHQEGSIPGNLSEGEATAGGALGLVELVANLYQDWGEVIDVSVFSGRIQELSTLKQWIVQDNCRLVGLLGMGGIGKTALSVKFAQQIQHEFEYVIWRSLQNAPPVNDILATMIQFLSKGQVSETDLPKSSSQRITLLIDYLRSSRCLLLLDNFESILQAGASAGQYRFGFEGYGQLLKRVGETCHRSCLMLTSCEKPQELAVLEGETLPVRSLELTGLNEEEGRAIFEAKGTFVGTPDEWKALIQHYAGNPLTLKLVASGTREVFGEPICELIKLLKVTSFPFAELSQVLERQFSRLTELEKKVISWLAINRASTSLSELQKIIVYPELKQQLLEVMKSLRRKSLIETRNNALFTLQPLMREYAINLLTTQVNQDIINGKNSQVSNENTQGEQPHLLPLAFPCNIRCV